MKYSLLSQAWSALRALLAESRNLLPPASAIPFPKDRFERSLHGIERTEFPETGSVVGYGQNLTPPSYIIELVLRTRFGKLERSYDKSAWALPVRFQGEDWVIDDWKRYAWRVWGPPNRLKAASALVRKLRNAARVIDRFISTASAVAIERDKFSISNNQPHVFGLYRFFREQAEKACGKQIEVRANPSKPNSASPEIADAINRLLKQERETEAFTLAAIVLFYSYVECLLDSCFALGDRKGRRYREFMSLDWSGRLKFFLDLESPEVKQLFEKLISIRRQYRNSVTHSHLTKYVSVPGFGLVPARLGDLSHPAARPFASMSIEECRGIFSTFDELTGLFEKDPQLRFYYYYACSGLGISFDSTVLAELKQHMESFDEFRTEVDRRVEYQIAYMNMEV